MEVTIKGVDYSRYTTRIYQSGMAVTFDHVRAATKKNKNNENNLKKSNRAYRIHRNKVRAACCALFRRKRSYCLHFLTITVPFPIQESKVAKIWKIFLDQLRNQYKVGAYVWVKEYQKNGNIHYHILLDKSYISYSKLQNTWNNAIFHITGIMPETFCSVRRGETPRVYSIKRVKYYLSKYITKDKVESMNKEQKDKYFSLKEKGITDGVFLKKAYGYSDMDLFVDCLLAFNSDLLHAMFEGSKLLAVTDFYTVFSLSDGNKHFRALMNGRISPN